MWHASMIAVVWGLRLTLLCFEFSQLIYQNDMQLWGAALWYMID